VAADGVVWRLATLDDVRGPDEEVVVNANLDELILRLWSWIERMRRPLPP
jgi:hypothetical protein